MKDGEFGTMELAAEEAEGAPLFYIFHAGSYNWTTWAQTLLKRSYVRQETKF